MIIATMTWHLLQLNKIMFMQWLQKDIEFGYRKWQQNQQQRVAVIFEHVLVVRLPTPTIYNQINYSITNVNCETI